MESTEPQLNVLTKEKEFRMMEEAFPLPLQVRWLGKVRYRDALAIQESLFEARPENYLLLMEHLSVFTL